MSLSDLQQRIAQLEAQNNDFQQREQVSKILYQQLLQAYNNANTSQICRTNDIKVLSQLHEQEKTQLRRESQESLQAKMQEFKDVLDQLENLRESNHAKESHCTSLEEMLNEERALRLSQTRKLQIELEDLSELNRKIKESQQFAIHRLIGKHNEELQEIMDRFRKESDQQAERYQHYAKQTKQTAEKSIALVYQQLTNQENQNKILSENLKRIQKMFQQHQARYLEEKKQISNANQSLQKEIAALKRQCHQLEGSNGSLLFANQQLQIQNKKLSENLKKIELSSSITKKMKDKQCEKERSLSARLMSHIKMQQKDSQYREFLKQQKQKEQKNKQKKLVESLSNMKYKFEKQNTNLLHRLILTQRQNQQSRTLKQRANQSLIDLLKNSQFDDCPTELMTQIELNRTPQPLDFRQLDLLAQQLPFQQTFEKFDKFHPTLDTTVNESRQQPTNRKKPVKHLRIKSNVQTARQSFEKPKMLVQIETPCFEDHLKITSAQPRKINIKLKKQIVLKK